ncbi:MAG: hypothetical protein IID61_16135 [SAR324 cluster bacterium]|nr:hypothetical protein [SAR324 cluster bacterium]
MSAEFRNSIRFGTEKIRFSMVGLPAKLFELKNISADGVGFLSNFELDVGSKIGIVVSPTQVLAIPVIIRHCGMALFDERLLAYMYGIGGEFDVFPGIEESEQNKTKEVFRGILLGELGEETSMIFEAANERTDDATSPDTLQN